jgi:hypothetical protein
VRRQGSTPRERESERGPALEQNQSERVRERERERERLREIKEEW